MSLNDDAVTLNSELGGDKALGLLDRRYYNRERRHSTNDYLSQFDYEQHSSTHIHSHPCDPKIRPPNWYNPTILPVGL